MAISNLTTKARDETLRSLGLKNNRLNVVIRELAQSDEPAHAHLGFAYLEDGNKINVINGAEHLNQACDVVIFSAIELTSGGVHLAARLQDDTKYDYKSLIETEIAARRRYIHDDFTTYYEALRDVLIDLLGLPGYSSWHENDFAMLFGSTVESYLSIATPWDGYLDATLLHSKVRDAGDRGDTVYELSYQIKDLNNRSRELHFNMLCTLFEMMFGPITKVVTSTDLLNAGFDDSAEPQESDYWEFY